MATLSLPSMEHTFTVDVKGKETHKFYQGEFTYKRLTLGARAEVDKLYIKLTESLPLLPEGDLIFYDMLSYLRYGIQKSPDWWRDSGYGKDLYDANVIEEIYKECMNFEVEWAKKLEERATPKTDDKP